MYAWLIWDEEDDESFGLLANFLGLASTKRLKQAGRAKGRLWGSFCSALELTPPQKALCMSRGHWRETQLSLQNHQLGLLRLLISELISLGQENMKFRYTSEQFSNTPSQNKK